MVSLRIRSILWFSTGIMLAVVSVWVFAGWRALAVNPAESSIITVTPQRILDSRDGNDIGLPGPFLSRVPQKLQVTGVVPTATGTKVVVPDGASGVVMNVTPVGATRDGFISVEPGDAVGLPTTSSLNFTAGAINPNTVTVAIPTAGADKGKVRLTYDAFGQVGPFTDILVDVIGYTTNAGLVELSNRVRAIETASNVIPPGVTVTGNILWDESVIADNVDTHYFVPFPAKAPADPGGAKVNFAPDSTGATQDDDPQCTGSVNAPTAPAGKVCIYRSHHVGLDDAYGYSASQYGVTGNLLGDRGFVVRWLANGAPGTDMLLYATWAYTAP